MIRNRLMQLFKDNRDVTGVFNVEQADDEATVFLYDAVGGWFGVEAKDFVKDLRDIDAQTIHLRINSPGGDVFEARAIATALKQTKAKTVAHVDGVCASAATYIALSCDEVEMAEGAFFMIHKAWAWAVGNADDLLSTAALLEKVDDTIVSDYAKKTGLTDAELKQMMADETWMTAEEALENGFVDSIYEGEDVEARWNLDAYDNAPSNYTENTNDSASLGESIVFDRERFEKRLNLAEALA